MLEAGARPICLCTTRHVLRDFGEQDRAAFIAYQMDPRYRRLYGFLADDVRRAHDLFDRFQSWQRQNPRADFQVGIFEAATGRLCGCCGLRTSGAPEQTAVLGIELTPDTWGRYRVAIDAVSALLEYAFAVLDVDVVMGQTANSNTRVERLARWFGAEIVARREGLGGSGARGWTEVEWALRRTAWMDAGPSDRMRRRARELGGEGSNK